MLKTCFCLCFFFIVAVFAFLVIILLKLNQMKRLVRLSGPVQRQFPLNNDNSLEKWKCHFQGPLAEYFPKIGRQGHFLGHKTAGNLNFTFDFQQRKS